MDRRTLADFLRARREHVRPAEAGLSAGSRRRTPGLRREEVAQLAGISVDYYTRLEQARGPQPSRSVLTALGRAAVERQRARAPVPAGGRPGADAGRARPGRTRGNSASDRET